MGLFGRYTKKDFENNTEKFRESLDDMYPAATQMEGCAKLIVSLNIALDNSKHFPKGKARHENVRAIDRHIERLIGLLKNDAKEKSVVKFTEHARILLRVLEDSRPFGSERYDNMYFENEEALVDIAGKIYDITAKKQKLEQKKQELLEEEKALDPSLESEIQSIALIRSSLEAEEKALQKNLEIFQAEQKRRQKIAEEINGGYTPGIITLSETSFMHPADFASATRKNEALLREIMQNPLNSSDDNELDS